MIAKEFNSNTNFFKVFLTTNGDEVLLYSNIVKSKKERIRIYVSLRKLEKIIVAQVISGISTEFCLKE